jgi:hypothetical protein
MKEEDMSGFIKIYNEGTNSPFMARLFAGILELRELIILGNTNPLNREVTREEFDKLYDPIFRALKACRDAAKEIIRTVESYEQKIANGDFVELQDNAFNIKASIDDLLQQELGKLLDNGSIAAKDSLQKLLRQIFEIEIGFLYQKAPGYQKGIGVLRANNETLFADYLQKVREKWLQDFLSLRNQRHHGSWTLERTKYQFYPPKKIQVVLPNIQGLPVHEYARISANRVILLVENLIAYGFQKSRRSPIYITEIPLEHRELNNPRRFKAMLRSLNYEPEWEIWFVDSCDFI